MRSTTSELVSVDREPLIRALALVFAAASVFNVQAGRVDTPLGEFFDQEADFLQRELLGPFEIPDGDDPLEVEIQARAHYLTASALEQEARTETGLTLAYRKHGADMRKAGTVNVPFDNEMADDA